ncbi:hypothetical protein DTO027B5_3925 [Paecilomyces variotii]|nr:hypothetical protein DTO169C6_3112 [Paecilomyces variotii]KAJ9265870.1 hypothetical protein DTO195F2_1472 [Paecilomyces variotii]KAJ9291868.1 hypothetical protein DTO021C3_769 [Paecilomyces variotii]KAJ9321389.1 hypothetical protein DTO027B3_7548 [Paecilomyces variotii]KAJ9334217.1 hypothetical protein DTO027B5_3925 [Paecilomyces variotii]
MEESFSNDSSVQPEAWCGSFADDGSHAPLPRTTASLERKSAANLGIPLFLSPGSFCSSGFFVLSSRCASRLSRLEIRRPVGPDQAFHSRALQHLLNKILCMVLTNSIL